MAFADVEKSRQAAFRASSDTISEAARTPNDAASRRHKYLLAKGYETENLMPSLRSIAPAFFAAREIKWWRSPASGDAGRSKAPTRNMASSQVACVNALLPLAEQPQTLAQLLAQLDSDVVGVEPIEYSCYGTKLSSAVEFEWVGLTASLEGEGVTTRGAKVTSADALVVGRVRGGGQRAYLMEWKYLERYSGKDKGAGQKGKTRRARYQSLFAGDDSPFDQAVPMEELLFDPFYQLMRMLLLGARMVRERELGVSDYRVVAVCPEGNLAYRNGITSDALARRFRSAATVEDIMRGVLREPKRFQLVSPRVLFDRVTNGPTGWREYVEARYGW